MVRKLVVYKLLEVAEVDKRVVTVVEPRVDEAVDRKPFWKERVVEVAFSPEPRVMNGKAKPPPPPAGQEVLQSVLIQRAFADNTVEEALANVCKLAQLCSVPVSNADSEITVVTVFTAFATLLELLSLCLPISCRIARIIFSIIATLFIRDGAGGRMDVA